MSEQYSKRRFRRNLRAISLCSTAGIALFAASAGPCPRGPPPSTPTRSRSRRVRRSPAQPAYRSSRKPTRPETVLIFGRAEQQIGIAGAASEGAVGGADLTVRPILRVAELLEAVPGLIAAAHSGSGKANQYFLRGMNLDHGTDFTAYHRRRALELPHARSRPGLSRHQRTDSRDRDPDRLPQGALSRRSRRLCARGRSAAHDDPRLTTGRSRKPKSARSAGTAR